MKKRTNIPTGLTALILCGLSFFAAFLGCAGNVQTQDPPAAESAEPSAPDPTVETVLEPSGDRILFVNVGKADATLILSDGKCYMVDTGTAESVPMLFGALNHMGVSRIEAVFITHSHSDHVGGLEAVLAHYEVGTVYRAALSYPKEGKKNPADKACEKEGIKISILSAGDTLPIGGSNRITVLGPLVLNTDNDNDNSLVLDVVLNGKRTILSGDMQFAEEETLLDRYGSSLKTDVLRVGNHGNPDATGPEFAAAADPSIALISTDRNVDTDSANERVLALFDSAEILITDQSDLGYLVSFDDTNPLTAVNVIHDTELDLQIETVDKETQTVTIKNVGPDADLSHCMLLSVRGNEVFLFPDGAVLKAGSSCTVSGENGNGDYRWDGEKKPWNMKKDDPARLYDQFGNLLSAFN